MITYVNKKNASQYQFLYEIASYDLRTHDGDGNPVPFGSQDSLLPILPVELTAEDYMQDRFYIKDEATGAYKLCEDEEFTEGKEYFQSDDITTLDEYFSFIEELNKINRNKYTRLPLDEEVFTIDTATRAITVPPSFANGVAVQGDEVAEVVYFKVNRFFDVTDLDTKDIFIQWRCAAKNEDGSLVEGVSVPWIKDIESEPGYIIFGWPLSSDITKAAGEVQFAVRFYEFNDKKQLVYSLSTLTQKVTIKPALDFNLPHIILDDTGKINDMTVLINDRFENSTLVSGSVEALEPRWIKTLTTDNIAVEYVDLDLDENGFRTKSVVKSVQAVADDGGRISYGWRKFSIDNGDGMDIYSTIAMKETQDTARVEGKLYYQKAASGANAGDYIVYTGDVFNKDEDGYPIGGIFEKFSDGTIDGIGEYFVFATNRLRNSTKKVKSNIIIVRRPVAPSLTAEGAKDLATSGILEGPDFDLKLEVKEKLADEGKATYQWQKCEPVKDPKVEENWYNIDGKTLADFLVEGTAEETAEAGGVGDGYYRVVVTNNINKEKADTVSTVCRVTHHATTPTVKVVGDVSFTLDDMIVDHEYLEIEESFPANCGERNQRTDDDKISYQWYQYRANGRNVEDDIEASDAGTYQRNVNDTAIVGETGKTYQPTRSGYYYCEVTNLYNGTTASKTSRFFAVADA